MSVRFQLHRQIMGSAASIEIDSARFEAIRSASQNLVVAVGLEEKFNVALDNLVEFEGDLLTLAQAWVVFNELAAGWSSLNDKRVLVNRRLANYLSATRAYIEQLPRGVDRMCGQDSLQTQTITAAFSHEFDTLFAYRVIEALRNYTQHNTFPISGITPGGDETYANNRRQIRMRIVPHVSLKALSEDPSVNRKVATELRSYPEKVSVTPLVRAHVSALGRVHAKYQALLRTEMATWESVVHDAIAEWTAAFGDDSSLVASRMLLAEDNEWEEQESVPLFAELIERRIFLAHRTSLASSIEKCFVSGQAE